MKPWRSLSSGKRHRNRPGGGNPPRVVGVAGRAAETEAAMVSRALVSATGVVFVGWAAFLRARAGTPCSLPAGAARVQRFRFWLQEVPETHGQLEVGALVAVHGIAPPHREEAVHEISHSTAVVARQYVACEEDLRAPVLNRLVSCWLKFSRSWRSFLPASTAVSSYRQTLAPQSTYICRVLSSVWRLPKY
jgi:hypothetical protein